jgi:tRNA(Arg) A34 adenosine deaminase TadA
MNNQQRRFMQRAIDLATGNVRTGTGGPFAAVIVRDGTIVAEGTNLVTSTDDPTAHAEIVAIRKACRELETFALHDCQIYASCEPCPMCLGAIYWSRLGTLYYAGSREDAAAAGFDDSFIYQQIALPPEQRSLPAIQLMREESLEAFRQWKESERKIEY